MFGGNIISCRVELAAAVPLVISFVFLTRFGETRLCGKEEPKQKILANLGTHRELLPTGESPTHTYAFSRVGSYTDETTV